MLLNRFRFQGVVAAAWLLAGGAGLAADLKAVKVSDDLEKADGAAAFWAKVPEQIIQLTAQPMVAPRPATTTTADLKVSAVHSGDWLAFRLRWKDTEKSVEGKLGTNSDGVAIQFPVKAGEPPAVFMGAKDAPVHILHWRATWDIDREKGRVSEPADHYPNMHVDMYPLEFKVEGNYPKATQEQRDQFLASKAVGNPVTEPKLNGVAELLAEGYGTSSAIKGNGARAVGSYANGEWTVFLARPLDSDEASKLDVKVPTHVAFAVWQGGKDEVGARKSVTMMWTKLVFGDESAH